MMGQAAGPKNSYIQYYPRFVSYLLKVSAQGCAFSAREQCSPKFLEPNRKKTLKFWTHDRTLTREQREIQTCITQQCCVDRDQSSHGIATVNGPSWVVLRLPPTYPRWRTAAILNFVKCLRTVLDDDSCTHFGTKMQHDRG